MSIRLSLMMSLIVLAVGLSAAATQEPPEITQLRAKAEQGDAETQFSLGIKYKEGGGVAKPTHAGTRD